MRGNPTERLTRLGRPRSIPARAGQPILRRRAVLLHTVYPRACGATTSAAQSLRWPKGLSPRVRGNHVCGPVPALAEGSIPARAGQPDTKVHAAVIEVVYPRACGATAKAHQQRVWGIGLSPRVRGNRARARARRELLGSIPARAGQPARRCSPTRQTTVYPRACGATDMSAPNIHLAVGLSPRVRGNPAHRALVRGRDRSIPARAGQPPTEGAGNLEVPVYPRACGATTPESV